MGRQYATKDERQWLQRKYSQKLGTTTFNNRASYKKKFETEDEKFSFPIYTTFRSLDLVNVAIDDNDLKTLFKEQFWDKDNSR